MNCRHAQKLLSASLDRELRPAREASLQAHLGDCSACRERRALLRRAASLLNEPAPPPPAGLAERIIRAAAEPVRPAGPAAFPAWAPRLAWATAALLCILAGAYLGDQLAPSPAAETPAAASLISGNEPLAPIYTEPFRSLPSGSPSAAYLTLIEEGGR